MPVSTLLNFQLPKTERMRQRLESWLLDNWYATDKDPNLLLRALEPVYRCLAGLRRRLIRPGKLQRPVIVVGNLTTGGSGKTPLVIALCHLLQQNGVTPGVISRGYGRSDTNNRRVTEHDDAAVIGDEPLLIFRRTGAAVAVASKRIEAAALLEDEDIDILIADDGLQHYQLPRSIEICVIDGQRRFGNGHLLPAGPLRESQDQLEHVDFLVCNGGQPEDGEHLMKLTGNTVTRLADGQQESLIDWVGRKVDAIAAIGYPDRFFAMLREAGIEVSEKGYPDHYQYQPDDFANRSTRALVMTEKDAVKCSGFGLQDAWYLSVDAELPDDFCNAFLQKVDNILPGKNSEKTA